MRALVYLLKTTIINYFKRLKEKPQRAIGPIFVFLWLAVMFLPNKKKSGDGVPYEVFVSIFVLIITIMFLYSLYSGTKKIDSKFGMCDVNLIFTSPIKPQTILIYGIVKKIALELLTSFYLLYQLPNIFRNLNVPKINQFMLVVNFLIFQLVLCNIIKLFTFALNTRYKNLGAIIRSSIKALIILTLTGAALIAVKGNFLSFIKSLSKGTTYSLWIKYIPVFGWMKEIALQTLTGIRLSYGIYVLLILLLSGLLLYITYNMELDFYEDMLSSAEDNDLIKNIQSGKEHAGNRKRNFLTKPFKETKLKLEGSYGAKVLFFKHLNEYLKRSLIFFVNTYSLILLTISIILGVFAKGIDIKIIFLIASGLLFFSSGMGGKIYSEIDNYFIFLLPDSPQKKLFYGTASSFIKLTLDALILFLPFGLLSGKSIFEILLCIICYLTLGWMLSYSGLFAFRIAEFLGFTGVIAQGLLFMFFQLFLMVPAVVITVVMTAFFANFSGYSIYYGFLLYSIIASILFSFGCVGIFNDMEIRQ